jgi:hypothetical protein
MVTGRSLLRGTMTGLVIALPFAGLVLVLAVLNGSQMIRMQHGHLVSAPWTIAMLLAGGVVIGGIVGALWPLMRGRVGAIVIGVLAALPVAVASASLLMPRPWSSAQGRVVILVTALSMGVIIGLQVRYVLVELGKQKRK